MLCVRPTTTRPSVDQHRWRFARVTLPRFQRERLQRWDDYDWCRSVSFEGRITRVEWKAPHSVVDVQADAGTTYHVELTTAQLLARQHNGAPPAALTFGARVAVIAHPARDAAAIRASVPEFKGDSVPNTVDPAQIRRVDNTFTWGTPPAATPLNCDPK